MVYNAIIQEHKEEDESKKIEVLRERPESIPTPKIPISDSTTKKVSVKLQEYEFGSGIDHLRVVR